MKISKEYIAICLTCRIGYKGYSISRIEINLEISSKYKTLCLNCTGNDKILRIN
jgi:hypothetical protein